MKSEGREKADDERKDDDDAKGEGIKVKGDKGVGAVAKMIGEVKVMTDGGRWSQIDDVTKSVSQLHTLISPCHSCFHRRFSIKLLLLVLTSSSLSRIYPYPLT